MLTNKEIVEIVCKTYNIKKLIIKMISYSEKDGSCYDLEQYIYEQLLHKSNEQLNQLYNDKKLRNYISQIVRNQRDGGSKHKYSNKKINTEYQKYFHIKCEFQIDDMDGEGSSTSLASLIYEDDTYDYEIDIKSDFVNNELNKYMSWWGLTGLTRQEQRFALGAKFLVFTIDRKIKMSKIAEMFGMKKVTRQTIWRIISETKKQIKDDFDIYYSNNYVD